MSLRVFIAQHGCDDEPFIMGTDPDPRDPAFDRYRMTAAGPGEDFSAWYVREQKPIERKLACARAMLRLHRTLAGDPNQWRPGWGMQVPPGDIDYDAMLEWTAPAVDALYDLLREYTP